MINSLGLKANTLSGYMCITVKSVIKYYIKQNSTVFTCFLDAAKIFDRVSH